MISCGEIGAFCNWLAVGCEGTAKHEIRVDTSTRKGLFRACDPCAELALALTLGKPQPCDVGDIGSVCVYLNHHFQKDFAAGEPVAAIVLRLLAELQTRRESRDASHTALLRELSNECARIAEDLRKALP